MGVGLDFGGGKQNSSGSSSTISPYAALAGTIAKKIEGEVDPLRAQFLHMLLQVVNQGGSAAGTPLANTATSASMEAGAQNQQDAATQLARNTGGTANPVMEAILQSLKQQSSQATSQIPTNIGSMLLGQVPGAVTSAQSGASTALGQAIGGYSVNRFNNQTTSVNGSGSGFLGGNPATSSTGGAPAYP